MYIYTAIFLLFPFASPNKTLELFSGCAGRGDLVCATCNAGQEPGYYKENQMNQCPTCYGRGLIAHKDGSDTL